MATTPANAILNYLYALLEAESTIALLVVGLDPGLGVLHADQRTRASLACDVMEAVRPEVDAYLLQLLRTHTFNPKDFLELRNGSCRISSSLAKSLAETAPNWRRAVAPVAEWIAKAFVSTETHRPPLKLHLPTPLTEAHRSSGRVRVHGVVRVKESRKKSLPKNCRDCGQPLEDAGRLLCDACLPAAQAAEREAFLASGPKALAQWRTNGDAAARSEAARKIGLAIGRRNHESSQWEKEHGPADPEYFRREILPGLANVPLSRLMAATGLSLHYVSQIRRGRGCRVRDLGRPSQG